MWQEQLISIVEGNSLDPDHIEDLLVTYEAETGDASLRGCGVEVLMFVGALRPWSGSVSGSRSASVSGPKSGSKSGPASVSGSRSGPKKSLIGSWSGSGSWSVSGLRSWSGSRSRSRSRSGSRSGSK
jgi:hypothetical protein